MIQCPNYSCQAINAEAHRFCHQCQAPVPRRFLWAVGHRVEEFKPGTIIAERYLCKARQIFLDLKPGLPPGTLSEIPFSVLPYLRLTPYRLHLPQVYGWADGTLASGDMTRLMLLENSALHASHTLAEGDVSVLPSLQEAWSSGSAFQQLHWLWQIAHLWDPLASEHISSTLLDPEAIRVEASLIRLLYLHVPQPNNSEAPQPHLPHLGQSWNGFLAEAQSAIHPFLKQLCQKIVTGYFPDSHALVTTLDLGLKAVGRSHTVELGISTQTDKGPSRANNQDACFPSTGSVTHTHFIPGETDTPHTSLVVVCDGIGGHQGGEIASATAIEEITNTLETLELPTPAEGLNPWMVHDHLNVAIAQANDAINQRNDEEKRRERARMGTTVVMGLLHDYECYLSNVGDSRVYWITPSGCHQITLDDDVASREARLGYGTYRSVLYHPNAGALVQALGMGPSKNLYPSGQRIVLGEEGLLLLCSDGLSDQDLIETAWESALLPLFQKTDQATHKDELLATLRRVTQDLIDLANTRNGHDNVTVGLVQWRSRQTSTIQMPTLDTLIATYNQRVDVGVASGNEPDTEVPTAQQRPLSELLDARSVDADVADQDTPRTAFAEVASPKSAVVLSPAPPTPTSAHREANDSRSPSIQAEEADRLESSEPSASSEDDITWISPSASSQTPHRSPLFVLMMAAVSLFGLFVLAGGVVYFGIPEVGDRINAALGINPDTDRSDPPDLSPLPPEESGLNIDPTNERRSSSASGGVNDMEEAREDSLAVGHILNLRRKAPVPRTLSDPNDERLEAAEKEELLLLFAQPPTTISSNTASQIQGEVKAEPLDNTVSRPVGVVPWGSILQVQKTLPLPPPAANVPDPQQDPGVPPDPSQQPPSNLPDGPNLESVDPSISPEAFTKAEADRWVQVELCFTPTEPSIAVDVVNQTILSAGSKGWISERQLRELSYLDRGQASPLNGSCSFRP